MQGFLHAAPVQRCAGATRALQATMAIGEQQRGVMVRLPEPAQDAKRDLGQWHKPIPVAFGVAYVHPVAHCIDVGDLQGQAFAQAQAQAVQGEVEHPVAQSAGRSKQPLRFFDGDDVGQA